MNNVITTLHLGLSYACNLKCKHCYVSKQKDMLNSETIKHIIDTLESLQIVIYTYGEPLLAKNLLEIASYVKSKNIMQLIQI